MSAATWIIIWVGLAEFAIGFFCGLLLARREMAEKPKAPVGGNVVPLRRRT